MARDRPGSASRTERFRANHTAFDAGAWNAASGRGNAGRTKPPPAPSLQVQTEGVMHAVDPFVIAPVAVKE